MFKCLSVYKLKPESVNAVIDIHPDIEYAEDDNFADTSYIFVPELVYFKNKKQIKSSLQGAYCTEFPGLLDDIEVNRMLNNMNVREEILIGSRGFLEGFGNVLFYVLDIKEEELTLAPIASNIYKKIIADRAHFKLSDTSDQITYKYNTILTIDCDIFPNIENNDFCELYYKDKLISIMLMLSRIISHIKIELYRPTPTLAMVGSSLGISTTLVIDNNKNLVSDIKGSSVYISPVDGTSILQLYKISKTEVNTATVSMGSLYSLFNYATNSGCLSESEAYQLLNKLYFNNEDILHIELSYNPLEGQEYAISE